MQINKNIPVYNLKYTVDLSKLSTKPMESSGISIEEFHQQAVQREFDRTKTLALSADSIRSDLYGSFQNESLNYMDTSVIKPVYLESIDNGTFSDLYDLTSGAFINSFVTKDAFYRDLIASEYKGDELTTKLEEYKQIHNEVLNTLVDTFSKDITTLLNGEEDWLYDDKTEVSNAKNSVIDKNAFKNNILSLVQNQKNLFKSIKENYSDQWQTLMKNGSGINFFHDKLEQISLNSSEDSFLGYENMNYSELSTTCDVLSLMKSGTYTNSGSFLGAFLGQMKLKVDIYLENSNVSDDLKSSLMNITEKNIS
ncbi:MAG TPA: hypothetical protein VN426_18395, partial [Syntrophomonadaceae bacterium]|nr:hypothetical protein [Syntrophomonadaceae bacterium]